ncbi:hypothetical protein HYH03_013178 [Edaphochlamys debaryana]|uniref:Uncharacterized protein n=1 Tax=Edaphochlamys debaryana TaxID=47281 RepID=A0A835XQD4_9CHLO|nr:hypothetical protein HYH03_013178 [Edaphochlamys debaryana]|eukprot:KAG2488328.1 hypothetical protein HYH03_013178 [Edaphochlamys debaryana]
MASGSLDFTTVVWQVSTGRMLYKYNFGKPIASLAFDPSGTVLVVSAGHKVFSWQFARLATPVRILKTRRSLRALHFHPTAPHILLTAEVTERRPSAETAAAAAAQQAAPAGTAGGAAATTAGGGGGPLATAPGTANRGAGAGPWAGLGPAGGEALGQQGAEQGQQPAAGGRAGAGAGAAGDAAGAAGPRPLTDADVEVQDAVDDLAVFIAAQNRVPPPVHVLHLAQQQARAAAAAEARGAGGAGGSAAAGGGAGPANHQGNSLFSGMGLLRTILTGVTGVLGGHHGPAAGPAGPISQSAGGGHAAHGSATALGVNVHATSAGGALRGGGGAPSVGPAGPGTASMPGHDALAAAAHGSGAGGGGGRLHVIAPADVARQQSLGGGVRHAIPLVAPLQALPAGRPPPPRAARGGAPSGAGFVGGPAGAAAGGGGSGGGRGGAGGSGGGGQGPGTVLPASHVQAYDLTWGWDRTPNLTDYDVERQRHHALRAAPELPSAAVHDTPCVVSVRLWDHREPGAELRRELLVLPRVVLCSEMGIHFSPCGRFMACCVARDAPSDACRRWMAAQAAAVASAAAAGRTATHARLARGLDSGSDEGEAQGSDADGLGLGADEAAGGSGEGFIAAVTAAGTAAAAAAEAAGTAVTAMELASPGSAASYRSVEMADAGLASPTRVGGRGPAAAAGGEATVAWHGGGGGGGSGGGSGADGGDEADMECDTATQAYGAEAGSGGRRRCRSDGGDGGGVEGDRRLDPWGSGGDAAEGEGCAGGGRSDSVMRPGATVGLAAASAMSRPDGGAFASDPGGSGEADSAAAAGPGAGGSGAGGSGQAPRRRVRAAAAAASAISGAAHVGPHEDGDGAAEAVGPANAPDLSVAMLAPHSWAQPPRPPQDHGQGQAAAAGAQQTPGRHHHSTHHHRRHGRGAAAQQAQHGDGAAAAPPPPVPGPGPPMTRARARGSPRQPEPAAGPLPGQAHRAGAGPGPSTRPPRPGQAQPNAQGPAGDRAAAQEPTEGVSRAVADPRIAAAAAAAAPPLHAPNGGAGAASVAQGEPSAAQYGAAVHQPQAGAVQHTPSTFASIKAQLARLQHSGAARSDAAGAAAAGGAGGAAVEPRPPGFISDGGATGAGAGGSGAGAGQAAANGPTRQTQAPDATAVGNGACTAAGGACGSPASPARPCYELCVFYTGTSPVPPGAYPDLLPAYNAATFPAGAVPPPPSPTTSSDGGATPGVDTGPAPHFGALLCARPVAAAHCMTSVQISPCGKHVLVSYGRRHISLCSLVACEGRLAAAHSVVEVYSIPDLALVRVLLAADDEVNVAAFNAFPAGGLAYGTKEGRLRLIRHDRRQPVRSSIPFVPPPPSDDSDGSPPSRRNTSLASAAAFGGRRGPSAADDDSSS